MHSTSRIAALLVAWLIICSHVCVSANKAPPGYSTTVTKWKTTTVCKKTKTVTKTTTITKRAKVTTVTQKSVITPTTVTTSTSLVTEIAISTETTTTVSAVLTVPAPAGFSGVRDSFPAATFDPGFLSQTPGGSGEDSSPPSLMPREEWTKEKWWKRNSQGKKPTKTYYTTKTRTIYSTKTTTKTSTCTVQGKAKSTTTVTSISTAPTSTSTTITTSNIIPPVIVGTSTTTTFTSTSYAACGPSNIANAFVNDEQTFPIRRFPGSGPAGQNQVMLGLTEDGTACCNLFMGMPSAVDPTLEGPNPQPGSAALFSWDSDSRMCIGYYHSTYECITQQDELNRQSVQARSRSGPEGLGLVVGNGRCGFIDDFEFFS